jgi:hypothetical protein
MEWSSQPTPQCSYHVKLQSFPTKWLLVDDALKFHVKFGILFVHFSPNSTHQTCFLSNHTWAPSVVTSPSVLFKAAQVPSLFHTPKKKSFPCVPRKLLELASSSTTSKGSLMPRMTINNEQYRLCHYSHPVRNKRFLILLLCLELIKWVTTYILKSSLLHETNLQS